MRFPGATSGLRSLPCFHLAESIAVSEDRSAAGAAASAVRGGLRRGGSGRSAIARRPLRPVPLWHAVAGPRRSVRSPFRPCWCSPMYSSAVVGSSCFMPSLMRRRSRSSSSTSARTILTGRERFARMIQPFLAGDVGDVDHALDAVAQIDEAAELCQAGDRAFHHGSGQRTSWRFLPTDRRAPVSARARCGALRGLTPRTTASTISPLSRRRSASSSSSTRTSRTGE